MEKLKNIFNKSKYLLMILIFFGSVYIINNVYVFGLIFKNYFSLYPLCLTLFYVSIIIIINFLLPKIGKRIYLTIIQVIFSLITIANYFYINYFNYLFSWSDLTLGKEGATFISSIFPLIDIRIISVLIYFIVIIVLTFLWTPNCRIKFTKKITIPIIIYVLMITTIYINITQVKLKSNGFFNSVDSKSVLSNESYYYTEWVNNVNLVKIVGIYEYTFKDLYRLFFNNDNKNAAYNYVDNMLESYENKVDKDNEYYGIFKDKNLILIMMESFDDWQMTKKSTPTIYKLKQKGIDFTNHHSLTYVTGKTAQSEFIANTGIYPKFNSLSPHYAYYNNTYDYSLANLFKNKGYKSNAYHRSNGAIYNREKMLLSLGYERYIDYSAVGLNNDTMDLDTAFISGAYPSMTKSEKFMHFWITFSNHPDYTLNKKECSLHYDKMKEAFPDEKSDIKLCGYAQAYEMDSAFKILIENLEKDNLLEDTVIIAYSDHPNGDYYSSKESKKKNFTQMFIYNPILESKKIDVLTNTINIMPMINSLFALDSQYFMASYNPLLEKESYLLFDDLTIFENNEYKPIDESRLKNVEMSKNLLISDYYNKK